MHFAEFVHMLQSGHLDDLFPDRDWKESCKEIHDLRRAFDSADVDGDNKLEQGEFELVMDTLHLGHDLTPEELELQPASGGEEPTTPVGCEAPRRPRP